VVKRMFIAVLLVFLLSLAVGQECVMSYRLLDLKIVSTDGNGVIATWRVPEEAPEFSHFSLLYISLSSLKHRSFFHIYPSNSRLNRTDNMLSFTFDRFEFPSLTSYSYYGSYIFDNHIYNAYGPYLITVVGYNSVNTGILKI
jgi:hypothetical protein